MLGEAIGLLKQMPPSAEHRARVSGLGNQIWREDNAWTAYPRISSNGYVFAGQEGEALVISPSADLFRGNLGNPDQFTVNRAGELVPLYAALKQIK